MTEDRPILKSVRDRRMKRWSRIKVFFSWDDPNGAMDVMVGLSKPNFDDLVAKTIRWKNVDLGLKKDGRPAYIRVSGAERIDDVFKAIAARLKTREGPASKQLQHVLDRCGELMADIAPGRTQAKLDIEHVGSVTLEYAIDQPVYEKRRERSS